MTKPCPLCENTLLKHIFNQPPVPIFQNRVFETKELAKSFERKPVTLSQCQQCGFIFNSDFDATALVYDMNYHNEQEYSGEFQKHLALVSEIIRKNTDGKNCIEIGCGKGSFLIELEAVGFNVSGYDPSYEGDDPRIQRVYFGEESIKQAADIIVLRHTLEHIEMPYHFLKTIGKMNNWKGKIFIEVPDMHWIVENGAFWDIFYEHCNYFTRRTLEMMFSESEMYSLFDGQYIGLLAELSSLKKPAEFAEEFEPFHLTFGEKFSEISGKLNSMGNYAIWGAGAKGSTFLNIFDPSAEKINCALDINPYKQGKYVGGTGHPILHPELIPDSGIDRILVMNTNYYTEIATYLEKMGCFQQLVPIT